MQESQLSNPHITVVVSLYNSAPFIEEFYRRCKEDITKHTTNFSFIFVNDGSPDNSKEVVVNLIKKDARVSLLDLSRNFGHHKAILCGLSKANGDFVFLTDVDLEEPPEDFSYYWDCLKKEPTVDVVYGFQNSRKGFAFEKISGWLFYKIINFLSDTQLKQNLVMSRLMSRRYVNSLLTFEESEMMLAGLLELTGYRQIGIPVSKLNKGSSTYTLSKKITLMVNAVTSLSSKPLYYVFYIGVMTVLMSLLFIIYLLVRRFSDPNIFSGWTSLMLSIWFLSGIILTSSGLICIYLSKVFLEVKRRPRYIIREHIRSGI